MELDFGRIRPGEIPDAWNVEIANWLSPSGHTAGLTLLGVEAFGDVDAFWTDFAPFETLAPGGTRAYSVLLESAGTGVWETVFRLSFADEDIPGGTALGDYFIVVSAHVIPESGAVSLLVSAIILLSVHRAWRVAIGRRSPD